MNLSTRARRPPSTGALTQLRMVYHTAMDCEPKNKKIQTDSFTPKENRYISTQLDQCDLAVQIRFLFGVQP
jgi:hypothetical protein